MDGSTVKYGTYTDERYTTSKWRGTHIRIHNIYTGTLPQSDKIQYIYLYTHRVTLLPEAYSL